MTKVITNRLETILPSIISQCQGPGRLILDHVLVAFEIFHSMHRHLGVNGSMTIKLDSPRPTIELNGSFSSRLCLNWGLMLVGLIWLCIVWSLPHFLSSSVESPGVMFNPLGALDKVTLFPHICCFFVQKVYRIYYHMP